MYTTVIYADNVMLNNANVLKTFNKSLGDLELVMSITD